MVLVLVSMLVYYTYFNFLPLFRFLEVLQPEDGGFLHSYSEVEAKLPSALVEELFDLTLLIGRLRDLPSNVQSALTIHHQGKVRLYISRLHNGFARNWILV